MNQEHHLFFLRKQLILLLIFRGHIALAQGGHIALADGGQFTLVLGGQFDWIFQSWLTGNRGIRLMVFPASFTHSRFETISNYM